MTDAQAAQPAAAAGPAARYARVRSAEPHGVGAPPLQSSNAAQPLPRSTRVARIDAAASEMAFRGTFPLSRETSKTGLRPVGRLLIELLPTGLRPVVSSSNTGNVGRRSILLAIDHHPPFPLDMFTLRLRVVGAPTIRDALRQLPAPTARIAPAEMPRRSSVEHALFSAFPARPSRRPWLLRTDKNSLSLRILGLARPSTLAACLRCPSRRWLTRKPRAGPHARPAQQPIRCRRHRAGLLPTWAAPSFHPRPRSNRAFHTGQAGRAARPSEHETTERHAWGNNARRRHATGLRETPSSPMALSLPATVDENLRNPPTSRCSRQAGFARPRLNARALGGCLCW
jgi:hypothetical protein